MPELVDKDGRYTNQGSELNLQILRAITPIIELYFKAGYPIHEIVYIVQGQVQNLDLEMRMARMLNQWDQLHDNEGSK